MLLGIWQERSHDFALNSHLLLMFKRSIYLNKDHNNISGLKAFIKSIENTERRSSGER